MERLPLPIGQLIVRSERQFTLRGSPRRTPFINGEESEVLGDLEPSLGLEQEVERLYRTEGGPLWRAVMAYCGDREIANDAVAEAFAQLLARGEAVNAPLAWLWRSSFRIAAGDLKARRGATPSRTEATYVPSEPLIDVLRALKRLSPNQREAVILHDYADLPTAEVARIMRIGQATVRVHVSQARRRLRHLLEDRDG